MHNNLNRTVTGKGGNLEGAVNMVVYECIIIHKREVRSIEGEASKINSIYMEIANNETRMLIVIVLNIVERPAYYID